MRTKSKSHKFYRISQKRGREWLECEAQTAATMLLTMREDNARKGIQQSETERNRVLGIPSESYQIPSWKQPYFYLSFSTAIKFPFYLKNKTKKTTPPLKQGYKGEQDIRQVEEVRGEQRVSCQRMIPEGFWATSFLPPTSPSQQSSCCISEERLVPIPFLILLWCITLECTKRLPCPPTRKKGSTQKRATPYFSEGIHNYLNIPLGGIQAKEIWRQERNLLQ